MQSSQLTPHSPVPLTARWEYEPDVGTLAGSKEKELMDILKSPREWAP